MSLNGFVDYSSIKPGCCKDHSMISLSLSLFHTCHKVLDDTVVINKKAMSQLLWDTVKDQILGSTIKYSSTKKKKEMEKLNYLEILLAQLEEQHDFNDDTAINSSIRDMKQEIYKIMEGEDQGSTHHFRLYEEGEKSSKSILNLEKSYYNNKVIN